MRVAPAFLLALLPALALAQSPRLGATIERSGVSLRMLDGLPLTELEGEGYRLTQQVSADRTLTVRVYHGPRLLDPIGAEDTRSDVLVCGRSAVRIVYRAEETFARPSYFVDGGIVHGPTITQPARTTIRLVFRHNDEHFLIVWAGAPRTIERYRRLERAFFASIRCR